MKPMKMEDFLISETGSDKNEEFFEIKKVE